MSLASVVCGLFAYILTQGKNSPAGQPQFQAGSPNQGGIAMGQPQPQYQWGNQGGVPAGPTKFPPQGPQEHSFSQTQDGLLHDTSSLREILAYIQGQTPLGTKEGHRKLLKMKAAILTLFLIFMIASPCLCNDLGKVFNVISYGAVGNGKTDDTKAFAKAWEAMCNANGITSLIIPKGKIFLLNPVQFKGPCKATKVLVQVGGTIAASANLKTWTDNEKWIHFETVDGLVINGGGQIDGQGSVWWNACSDKKHCDDRPTALHFHNCNGLQLSNLRHLNSQRNHISISGCKGVKINNLRISAPEDSPNTDGIDISTSSNIEVLNTVMETGDDCIAINGGSSNITISGVACGPGHGISIGSLGKNGAFDTVEEVHMRNCTFKGTQNAARIKTWQGGKGYARKISYENIQIINSQNPIIIDQNYNPYSLNANAQSAVEISDVTFRNVYGTSVDEIAIDLVCSDHFGCSNIVLNNIDIKSAIPGKQTISRCNNAHGSTLSLCTPIVPCLSH
ncbi:hypothetical protein SO802_023659 [Lithocarpus litseifolius]|uniref:endo-polygalacturonase n=1 Tax=Lithocarpus litseifolius TaxID=425828 RepID=A0AAW2C847_9ROSI